MLLTKPHAPRFGMLAVTFVHVLPPSRVRLTTPSLLPVHTTPGSTADSSIALDAHTTSSSARSGITQPLSAPIVHSQESGGMMPVPLIAGGTPLPMTRLLLGPRYDGPSCRLP